MRSTYFSVLSALGSAWILWGGTAIESRAAASPAPMRITVLYDAFGKDAAMAKDWGYAALVEINGKRILFDTGNDPGILARNAKARGADLTRLDFVVLSHRHSDHIGGFSALRRVNPKVRIYAPKENFGVFGSDLPGTFYRRDESLPAEMRYYGGAPPETMKFGTVFPGANIQLVDKTTEVAQGFTLIALISDAPGTKELKELSLAINTPDGVVLVVTRSITSLPATAPASRHSQPCKRHSATGTSMPDWERRWPWVRIRGPNLVQRLRIPSAKAICDVIESLPALSDDFDDGNSDRLAGGGPAAVWPADSRRRASNYSVLQAESGFEHPGDYT